MTPQLPDPAEPHRPPPPAGWRRTAARLPSHLFRMGLGPLFRGRLLLLVHTGRVSGLARRTTVEVVESTVTDGRHCWTVASGFGPGADWYRNLVRTPQATVQAGRRFHVVTAQFVAAEEGGELMARYAARHPALAHRLCSYLGYDVDGSTDGYRRAGESIPFVRLIAGSPHAGSPPASRPR
ncbi:MULTISPECIES: nitroreductase family deazaflavin-dependent oxidoreductase [Streptomyces]|uniref:nitroreductase family deazaflavin-dependent oxidoreductase n=1 Tax=Streptomyces TaxID=1883 RepID=UPI0021A829CE|nr:nitroreductase family deazaflavin-dependent oxidoreductase [Streptomyces atratus]MCT2541763.1 nitroreductase family deazaflavin-dependent oxidoreductase [Streptomyces atratus]